MAVCDVNDLADYIVNRCIENNDPISNLELQKLLFLCQKDYINITSDYLFDEDFHYSKKYTCFIVVPSVYRRYSLFAGLPITRKIQKDEISLSEGITRIVNPIIVEWQRKEPWELTNQINIYLENTEPQLNNNGNEIIPKSCF